MQTLTPDFAAQPALATLTETLRSPLIPVLGFAELLAAYPNQPDAQAWAGEVAAGTRQALAVLDCTLALLAGRQPPPAPRETHAAAEAAVAALHRLLAGNECGAMQRRIA